MQATTFFALDSDEQHDVFFTLSCDEQDAIIAAAAVEQLFVGELADGRYAQILKHGDDYWMLADGVLYTMEIADIVIEAQYYSDEDWAEMGWEKLNKVEVDKLLA